MAIKMKGCPIGSTYDTKKRKCVKDINDRTDILLKKVIHRPEFRKTFRYEGWGSPGGDTHISHKYCGWIPFNAIDDTIGYTIIDPETSEIYNFESWDPKKPWERISDGEIENKISQYLKKIDSQVKSLRKKGKYW